MRLISVIPYFSSIALIYFSMYIAEGSNLNPYMFWDLSTFICLLAGLVMALVNLKFNEIIKAIKETLSEKLPDSSQLKENQKVMRYIWRSIITAFGVNFIFASITVFGNAGTNKLGPYLGILLLFALYTLLLKLFIFMPLEIAIEKKIIIRDKEIKSQKITV